MVAAVDFNVAAIATKIKRHREIFIMTVLWTAAVDGEFTDATNWTPQTVPGAADVAAINVGGTYTVQASNALVELAGLTINNPNATLKLSSSTLRVDSNTPLHGSGGILLAGTGASIDTAFGGAPPPDPIKVTNFLTIAGVGTIGDDAMQLKNLGVIGALGGQLTITLGLHNLINESTLTVTDHDNLLELDSRLLNHGNVFSNNLDAVAGNPAEFHATADVINYSGAQIVASQGGVVHLDSSVRNAGTLLALSSGEFLIGGDVVNSGDLETGTTGSLTVTGMVINQNLVQASDPGSTLALDGGLANRPGAQVIADGGLITVGAPTHNNGTIKADGGSVQFDDTVVNGANGEIVATNGGSVTFNDAVVDSGTFTISDGTMTFAGALTLVGLAELNADSGGQIEIDGVFSSCLFTEVFIEDLNSQITFGSATNTGSIEAESGGTVIFQSAATNKGLIEACDSSVHQSQVTFQADVSNVGAAAWLDATEGGKLDVMGDVPRNSGLISADSLGLLTLHGDLINNFFGGVSATFGGAIDVLGAVSNYGIIGSGGADPDTAAPSLMTVEGNVTNRTSGEIIGDEDSVTTIGGLLRNLGSLEADNGAMFNINGNVVNGGTIRSSGQSTAGDQSAVNILGTLTGAGNLFADDGFLFVHASSGDAASAEIDAAGHLTFGGMSNAHVAFDSSGLGMLSLDQPLQFTGDISGFITGDAVALDLNVTPSSVLLDYEENVGHTGGLLHVQNNGAEIAALNIVGAGYSTGQFSHVDSTSGPFVTTIHVQHDLV